MSGEHDAFDMKGGCWCPGERTLYAMRWQGHTKECTEARRGWAANYRHMSEIDKQRRADQALGAAMREDVLIVLAKREDESGI